MSVQDLDLSSNSAQVLKVTVRGRVGHPGAAIFPQSLTLTSSVHTVIWHCDDLARGSRLQIHFPEPEPDGPFVSLESFAQAPGEVTGYGNRGPKKTRKEYDYEVRVVRKSGIVRKIGVGHLANKALKAVNHPHAGGLDPVVEPPAKP